MPDRQECKETGRQAAQPGEKACPWRQLATWEAGLNALEVLESSQPRTSGKHRTSISREKPARQGRSRAGKGDGCPVFPTSRLALLGQEVIAGRLLSHFTRATVSKGTAQTLSLHQSEVTTQFPARGRQGRKQSKEAGSRTAVLPSLGCNLGRVPLASRVTVVPVPRLRSWEGQMLVPRAAGRIPGQGLRRQNVLIGVTTVFRRAATHGADRLSAGHGHCCLGLPGVDHTCP